MIEIFISDNAPLEEPGACYFEDYHQLFEHITEIEGDLVGYITKAENSKPIAFADRDQEYWRFTVYPPQQVWSLYTHNKDLPEAARETVKEAFEAQLSLIEICRGDYTDPEYIVRTPNVDMNYLKKKWCIEYCAVHNIAIRENFNEQRHVSAIDREDMRCLL